MFIGAPYQFYWLLLADWPLSRCVLAKIWLERGVNYFFRPLTRLAAPAYKPASAA